MISNFKVVLLIILVFSVAENSIASTAKINEIDKLKTLTEKEKELEEAKKELEEAKIESEQKKLESLKAKNATLDYKNDLDKFGFGLGFGVITLHKSDITSSTVDNSIIRVTGEEKNKLGFWLTTSWINETLSNNIGYGPFFGLQLGGDKNIVNSLAFGIDFSFKRLNGKLPLDFQFGYGFSRINVLADGYEKNKAPPGTASAPLTKEIIDEGWVMIFSYKI